jgi:hypothetical protein
MSGQLPSVIRPAALTVPMDSHLVPALMAAAGEQAAWRYIDFFAANIRNPHTRRAYARACGRVSGLVRRCQRAIDRGRAAASRGRLDRAAAAEPRCATYSIGW